METLHILYIALPYHWFFTAYVLPKHEEDYVMHHWLLLTDKLPFMIFLLLGFDNASLSESVNERSTPNPVTLVVKRRFGLRGGSRVHWEARLEGVLANDDIEPVEGDLIFAQGEDEKTINFNVKPDATPEILEVSGSVFLAYLTARYK